MTAHDCRSELLVAARRGGLSEAGQLALEAHLATCASCRSSHQVSTDFDAADAIDLHDGARIRALADLARRRVGRSGGSAFAGARVAAAVGLLILCGSASAAVWWWRRPLPTPTIARAPAGGPIEAGARARAVAPAATPAPEAPAGRQRALRPPARAVALARPVDPMLMRPAAILQQATEARQRGERARAADLYRRLQREFPASPEATLSAVPLGGLLLDDDLPRAALAAFDSYLSQARGGALIPEALYGRARAFGRLGDRAEERKAWTRLCADFPDSAYAQLGRHRLAEIE
jgi:TolA-binding protein